MKVIHIYRGDSLLRSLRTAQNLCVVKCRSVKEFGDIDDMLSFYSKEKSMTEFSRL